MSAEPSAAAGRCVRATLVVALCAAAAGCGASEAGPVRPVVGDAAHGAIWISREGCGSCHLIPGVMHATGLVGPPLEHFAKRTIVAGYLANTPANLVHWIQSPQEVAPGNAMPNAGLDPQQARDIAAYLYTLK